MYYDQIKSGVGEWKILVLTSLKLFPPREWNNWCGRGWKYCLKWAQRPSAKETADYCSWGLFSCKFESGSFRPNSTRFSFQYLFTFDILKLSAFCHFCSFRSEPYLQLEAANKLIIRFIQWSSLILWESWVSPHDILPSPSRARSSPMRRSCLLQGSLPHPVGRC